MFWRTLSVLMVGVFVASGCAHSQTSPTISVTPSTSLTPQSSPTQQRGPAVARLEVRLQDGSITPAEITSPSPPNFLDILNNGTQAHELVVIRTDLAPDALPVRNDSVDLSAAGEVVGSVGPLNPGAEQILTKSGLRLGLGSGRYVLISNLPGDYQKGMRATLVIR